MCVFESAEVAVEDDERLLFDGRVMRSSVECEEAILFAAQVPVGFGSQLAGDAVTHGFVKDDFHKNV